MVCSCLQNTMPCYSILPAKVLPAFLPVPPLSPPVLHSIFFHTIAVTSGRSKASLRSVKLLTYSESLRHTHTSSARCFRLWCKPWQQTGCCHRAFSQSVTATTSPWNNWKILPPMWSRYRPCTSAPGFSTMANASRPLLLAPYSIRNIRTGRLGALPKPPFYCQNNPPTAWMPGAQLAPLGLPSCPFLAFRYFSIWPACCQEVFFHLPLPCAAVSSSDQPAITGPGKIVPEKGPAVGRRIMIVSGHPPCPFLAWHTDIYIRRNPHRRSSVHLNTDIFLFRISAITSFSNDSRSITWHQWHVLHPGQVSCTQ